jgi:hypothetical protein
MYGTQQHGISLNTFYTKLKDQGPSILVVEDSKKRVNKKFFFGCLYFLAFWSICDGKLAYRTSLLW